VLDIPDDYAYMDLELQQILRQTLDPEINSILAGYEEQG